MPIEKLNIESFLELAQQHPVLDVRSPGEYKHAQIPGAFNLPLFTDEERKVVGTTYKQQSREAAIKIGLEFFGPKMRTMIETVESIAGTGRQILVHCWRGGMRSAGVAWLLDLYGFKVHTLIGGYKNYRNWIHESFSFHLPLRILGGYTGSGKTYVLDELEKSGEIVINLERMANHKGSAFGDIGMPDQPTQEMFENLLGHEMRRLFDAGDFTPIWIEDESQRIGHINLPNALWNTMRQSPVLFIDIPFEERLKHIINEYGNLDQEKMSKGITRIQKRLGPAETKTALQTLSDGDIESCFRILLKYYDKHYNKALNNREELQALLTKVECGMVDAKANAGIVSRFHAKTQRNAKTQRTL
ncbi:MAG: tRNA 2-selenouridine(34) synthase MnmH [Chitinophagaceae bacterium]|nr:tRNA 2-selenouridine(34) synthase MnmH [Chitinophagaceae bacterium]